MNTIINYKENSAYSSNLRQHCFKLALAVTASLCTLSSIAQDENAQASSANTMPAGMPESIERYKSCIEGVMSTQERSAIKREQVSVQCDGYHQDMADFFPGDVREFITTNNTRRINAVLDALEAVEGVVDDSVEDSDVITGEITDSDMGEEGTTNTSSDG